MRRIFLVSFFMLILTGFQHVAFGQLPDFYRSVDRVIWVVDDLESVTNGWRELGFPQIQQHGEVTFENAQFRGTETRCKVRAATGHIGRVRIDWVEPAGRADPFSEFLAANGPGVFALVHRVPSNEILELELLRFGSLGVRTLLEGRQDGPLGWGDYLLFDTRSQGLIVLGLTFSESDTRAPILSDKPPFDREIAQYAFAVEDPAPVSEFWAGLGLPPFTIVPVEGREREYHGKPAEFEMNLGWQRHGEVAYEWCIPLKGPTVYQDHIRTHGEGFHHLGLMVMDLDETIARWEELGIPVIQSGAWGEKDKPGSGRYAYMNTDRYGGIAIELLWSFPN